MKLTKKILIIPLVLLGLALGAGAFWGQDLLEKYALQKGQELLQTGIEFDRFDLLPFEGKVIVHDMKVYHPDRKTEKIAEIEKITFRLKSFPFLFRDHKPIALEMERPKFVFTTLRDGNWELAGRIPLILSGPGQARLDPFDIETVSVKDGTVEFRDGRVSFPPLLIPVSKINFHADHWQLPTPENPLPTEFEADFLIRNSGAAKVSGKGDFLSPRTSFQADLKVKGISLPPFAAYYEKPLPIRIQQGVAAFSGKARCDKDQLKIPIHAEVSGLKIALKKKQAFGFMADSVVDTMKNSRGNVELDLLVTGDLRRPQFVVLTDMEPSLGQGFRAAGKEIKGGFKSGWKKFKGFFSKKEKSGSAKSD